MRFLSPLLATFLASLLIVNPLFSQTTALPTRPSQASGIEVQVVQTDVSAGSGPAVRVTDDSGNPVANAAVVFRLPDSGSTATFGDGAKSAVVYTDGNGQAHAEGIRRGSDAGPVSVKVTAAKGTAHAGVLFEQPADTQRASVPVPAAAPVEIAAPSSTAVSPEKPASPGVIAPSPSPRVSIEHRSAKGRSVERHAPEPGVASTEPVLSASANPVADDPDSPNANIPIRHAFGTGATLASAPAVSIVSSGSGSGSHSHKKLLILLAVAAGAGVAVAMSHKGGSGSSSASGVSIGSPTVSVGHP